MTRRRFRVALAAPLVAPAVPVCVLTVRRFIAPLVPPMADVWLLYERLFGWARVAASRLYWNSVRRLYFPVLPSSVATTMVYGSARKEAMATAGSPVP